MTGKHQAKFDSRLTKLPYFDSIILKSEKSENVISHSPLTEKRVRLLITCTPQNDMTGGKSEEAIS
jgi:hypothetical protein